MAEKEIVTFKLSAVEQIALDTHARNLGLMRTAFIRQAIDAQINNAHLADVAKREGSDLQKLYQAITELNLSLSEMKEGFNKLDNTKMKRLFDRLGRIEERLKL